jgi:tetratricopeptide (TPR) repeat protein
MKDDTKFMNDCYATGKWHKAETVCRKALKKDPNSHWWLIHLGLILIEKKQYDDAQEALNHAEKIEKYCPLVAWYQGVLHYDLEEWGVTLEVFQNLHNRCLKKLNSNGEIHFCWESIKRTEELDNDCRARIGFCHMHLGNNKKAVRWLREHLKNRQRGRMSTYDAKVVRRWIKKLEK